MVWMFLARAPKTAREGARATLPGFAESLGCFMIRSSRKKCEKCRLVTQSVLRLLAPSKRVPQREKRAPVSSRFVCDSGSRE